MAKTLFGHTALIENIFIGYLVDKITAEFEILLFCGQFRQVAGGRVVARHLSILCARLDIPLLRFLIEQIPIDIQMPCGFDHKGAASQIMHHIVHIAKTAEIEFLGKPLDMLLHRRELLSR